MKEREEKEKLIQEKLEEEEFVEMMHLKGVKQIVWEKLINEKKFEPEEIEMEPQFVLQLEDCEATVSINFVINLPPASFVVIKCANSGLESWERYITALARSVKDYQIPYAMVTTGDEAKIIDIFSGSLVGETMQNFFNRQEALEIMKNFKKIPCPDHRLEKEKRIVYAFEGIKCPSSKQK